jgi:hypothetical protein
VHPSPEFLLYILELRSHPVAPGFPAKKELAPAVAAAAMNVVRIDAWLTGRPLAKTRRSAFANVHG